VSLDAKKTLEVNVTHIFLETLFKIQKKWDNQKSVRFACMAITDGRTMFFNKGAKEGKAHSEDRCTLSDSEPNWISDHRLGRIGQGGARLSRIGGGSGNSLEVRKLERNA
jgi:hypothetical protein